MTMRGDACRVPLCPIFGYLNKVCLTILDNIETTGGKHNINIKKIHVKNDRMSLVFKKLIGKIQERNNNSLGHRFADLAKEFNEL